MRSEHLLWAGIMPGGGGGQPLLAAAPLTSHRSIRRPRPYAVNLLGLISSTLLCHGALILDINLFFFFLLWGQLWGQQ